MLDSLQQFATLPAWLEAAACSDRVGAALVQHIPEFARGELILQACEVRRLRFKGGRWTTAYQLTVGRLQEQTHQVVNISGALIPPTYAEPDPVTTSAAFGTKAWECYLPELRLQLQMQPSDAQLAALPLLTDPEAARTFLEQEIRAVAPAYRDIHIQACTPQVMRYKPGSRCTVLYRLEYSERSSSTHNLPEVVVLKTYHGDKGKNAYDGMYALWNSDLATDTTVSIAEPIAYLPHINVLIQGPIREEQTLKECMRTALRANTSQAMAELYAYMQKTAEGLAALHRTNVQIGDVRVWEDELMEIREVIARLAVPLPELANAVTPLLGHLEAIAMEYPPDPLVPSHGTFRPAQVLLHQGKIGFIDFDGFCQAEPALDIALFLGKVKDIGLNVSEDDENYRLPDRETYLSRLTRLEAMCEAFLITYESIMPISRKRVALWEALDLFTIVLHCWTKIKPTRLDNAMFLLERHLQINNLC